MTMWFVGASVVLTAIGTSISVYSAVAAGENAKETADYNAEMQRRAADDALQRGSIDAAEHRAKVRKMISSQVAAFGAGGIETSSGSALDVMTETAGMGELDALRIVNNSQRAAAGLKVQADLEEFKGRSAQSAGYLNATGTAIGGLGSMAGTYGKGVK
jgi:hypothetical protein